jgi:hypothetical protein
VSKLLFGSSHVLKRSLAIKYRPYPGSVPWGGDADKPEWEDPKDHKVNYFVPNFGKDSDIKTSFKNMATAEEELGHVLEASFDPPKEPKRNYFVPHFGEDTEIKYTKANIAAAEKKYNHEYDTSAPPADPKRNYFVPNFGEDTEIKYTKANIAAAEKALGHEYDTSDPPADPKETILCHTLVRVRTLPSQRRTLLMLRKLLVPGMSREMEMVLGFFQVLIQINMETSRVKTIGHQISFHHSSKLMLR